MEFSAVKKIISLQIVPLWEPVFSAALVGATPMMTFFSLRGQPLGWSGESERDLSRVPYGNSGAVRREAPSARS